MNVKFPTNVNVPLNATQLLTVSPAQLFQAWNECVKITQQEKTKRRAISAWKEKELTRIGEQSLILREFLNQEFRDRREVYQKFFEKLDQAIAEGNNDLVAVLSAQIVETVRQSPMEKAKLILQAINATSPLELDANTNNMDVIEI